MCQCCGANVGSTCRAECLQGIWDMFTCHLACCRPEPWWVCYACCGGCGVHEVMADRQWYYSSTKCCPLRCTMSSTSPWERDGCCHVVQMCCCWYTQCQIPPRMEGNPVCSCCGCGGTAQHPAACGPGAPSQQAMGSSDA